TFDPVNPNAPSPDNKFLDAVCSYLDTRRLITTEVFLRGPQYVGIWISIGIRILPGFSTGPVREAVKSAVRDFLKPASDQPQQLPDDPAQLFGAPEAAINKGWPLNKSVIALELMAVAGRVTGVEFVQEALLSTSGTPVPLVDLTGLQLPKVLGISVVEGAATSLDELRGAQPAPGTPVTRAAQVP